MQHRRFLRQDHIRSGLDFKRVYDRRCVASDNMVTVFAGSNGLPHARLGLSVSHKVGGAVVRNRWKRLIRETFRLSRHQLPPGLDLVVIPRRNVEPQLTALCNSLPRLAARLARKLDAAEDGRLTSGKPAY
jgi:ribonuclease P protein component